MSRVKTAMTPGERGARDDAHLAEKRAEMRERRRPQIFLLFDEAETRALLGWRRAPVEVKRQAREALKWFEEG